MYEQLSLILLRKYITFFNLKQFTIKRNDDIHSFFIFANTYVDIGKSYMYM